MFHDSPDEVTALAGTLKAMLKAMRPDPCVQSLPILSWKAPSDSREYIGGWNAGDDVNYELWTALLGLPDGRRLQVTHLANVTKVVSVGTVLNAARGGDIVCGAGARLAGLLN